MREIRTSGSMSEEGKRGDAQKAQATAPLLDSTGPGAGDLCVQRPELLEISVAQARLVTCH